MHRWRRLYLPEEWVCNKQRRAEARVPAEVRFETKHEQAIAMLVHAWEQGVLMRLSSPAMGSMGDAPRLRETIQAHGRFYVRERKDPSSISGRAHAS
jgi:DDE superfamily endonuclease